MSKEYVPKKITVKEINDMLWNYKWDGAVDDQALRERLRDLLEAEKSLAALHETLGLVKSKIKKLFGGIF